MTCIDLLEFCLDIVQYTCMCWITVWFLASVQTIPYFAIHKFTCMIQLIKQLRTLLSNKFFLGLQAHCTTLCRPKPSTHYSVTVDYDYDYILLGVSCRNISRPQYTVYRKNTPREEASHTFVYDKHFWNSARLVCSW